MNNDFANAPHVEKNHIILQKALSNCDDKDFIGIKIKTKTN